MDETTKREAAANAAATVRAVFDGSLGENAGLFLVATVSDEEGTTVHHVLYNLTEDEILAVARDIGEIVAEQTYRQEAAEGISKNKIIASLIEASADLLDAVSDGVRQGVDKVLKKKEDVEHDEKDKG